jgi:hypothetical protein
MRIQPEKTSFIVDGKSSPIMSGMTVQAGIEAGIVTDHRRVVSFSYRR